MARNMQDDDPNDPEANIRKRILEDQTADPGMSAAPAPEPPAPPVYQPPPEVAPGDNPPGPAEPTVVPPPPDPPPTGGPTITTQPVPGNPRAGDPQAGTGAGGPAPPGPTNYSVQGFDSQKLNDPTHQNAKYTPAARLFAGAIQGLDPVTTSVQTVADKINAAGGTAKAVGDDRIDFGDGYGPIDVKIDSGRGGWWFQNGEDRLGSSNGPGPAPGPGPSGGGAARRGTGPLGPAGPFGDASGNRVASGGDRSPGQPGGGLTAPGGLWGPDFINQLRQMIMTRLSAASQPVNEHDPNIAAPLTAARDESARATDRERTALAEHLYAKGGLNTDAISQGIQQSGERNAGALSGLRATLIQRELSSRREELKSLLESAMQSGDAQSAREVQQQIALLDATVRREGIGADLGKYSAYLNSIAGQSLTGT